MESTIPPLTAVLKEYCLHEETKVFTYTIDGQNARYISSKDEHATHLGHLMYSRSLANYTDPNFKTVPGHCWHDLYVYPTQEFYSHYVSRLPEILSIVIAATFVFVLFTFGSYEIVVRRRNDRLLSKAARSHAVVTSLFPGTMRDKILDPKQNGMNSSGSRAFTTPQRNIKSFLTSSQTEKSTPKVGGSPTGSSSKPSPVFYDSQPMAELFLSTTIMFADIAGFTAWSSTREPHQVFTLLETVYSTFDRIASTRRVFKVETVGDCYVAVTGLPEPRSDHAEAMVRFARQCLDAFKTVTRNLDVLLGPDTSELALRVGLHSGPVTGGVLRGDRARFQLFGDAMNTCSRIESTSQPGAIHLSKETAECLIKAGRGSWLIKRSDLVEAKGKGKMETYWINTSRSATGGNHSDMASFSAESSAAASSEGDVMNDRTHRLIDWNVQILRRYVVQIIRRRLTTTKMQSSVESIILSGEKYSNIDFLKEVKEIIQLPEFTREAFQADEQQVDDIDALDEACILELRDYVTCIASMYRSNPCTYARFDVSLSILSHGLMILPTLGFCFFPFHQSIILNTRLMLP